ncbi:hypothetical protein DFH29DRAFT_1004799 [Suillus ampliporus]|nr:hypothetical protein DFH29DRAFT_1004799 [Suillus ampliporus]
MLSCGPKLWTTIEEDAFLKALLPGYNRCRHQKLYRNFWINTFRIPAEGDLTPDQKEIVGLAITKRKEVIKHWFRWQTSTARLAHSGNSRTVLNLDDTFGGGGALRGSRAPQEVEVYSQYHYNARVKAAADTAIKAEGITSRGEKLSKRKEVTHIMYATEDDAIRTKVKQKHAEVLAKWKCDRELVKAGSVEEIDNDAKIQAFNELGSHLDRIFRHLSYKTGGLKFTCIAGRCNPSTGEVVVVDFHLGETDTGAEFSACYSGFLDIQVAYADFVKEAVGMSLANEEALAQALAVNEDVDKQTYEDEDRNIFDDHIPQELAPIQDFLLGLQLEATPHVDLDTGTLATAGEWSIDHLHTESDALLFEELDYSFLGMDEITNMIAMLSVPNVTDHGGNVYHYSPIDIPYEYPTTASTPSNLFPIQDFDCYELADLFQDISYDSGGLLEPVIPPPGFPSPSTTLHNVLPCDPHLPMVPDMQAGTPVPQSPAPWMLLPPLPNGTAGGATTGTATGASGDLNSLTAEQPKGPRHTSCRHVPSKREQALNVIGSSNARICAATGVMEGKENGPTFSPTKRKAKPINQQANKKQKRG